MKLSTDDNTIRQELVTYKKVNDRLVKEVITRRFYENTYEDTHEVIVLCS